MLYLIILACIVPLFLMGVYTFIGLKDDDRRVRALLVLILLGLSFNVTLLWVLYTERPNVTQAEESP